MQGGTNKQSEEPSNALYRLEILEEDLIHDRVGIRYIGYEGDKWRPRRDIVDLSVSADSDSDNESECEELSLVCHGRNWAFPTCLHLYELLACKIKSVLVCSLKGLGPCLSCNHAL